jgi:hypothetical protein
MLTNYILKPFPFCSPGTQHPPPGRRHLADQFVFEDAHGIEGLNEPCMKLIELGGVLTKVGNSLRMSGIASVEQRIPGDDRLAIFGPGPSAAEGVLPIGLCEVH